MENMKYMRMHSTLSYDILQYYDFSSFVLQSVLYHHENYDGSGYPDNLRGEAIPWMARILRVCDVFAALTAKRSYRNAFEPKAALEIMIDEVADYDMTMSKVVLDVYEHTQKANEELKNKYKNLKDAVDQIYRS